MYQWFWTVLNGTDRYWMALNGIWMVYLWPIFIRFFTIQIYHYDPIITPLTLSMVRYWMVFSVFNGIPFVYLLSFKIPLRPDKYWMVLQVINNIPFVYFLPFKVPLTNLPLMYQWYWTVPNGTERYWMVLHGIWMVYRWPILMRYFIITNIIKTR